MGISTAIPANDVSRTSGYQLQKGNFSTTGPYLPPQVVILAEANTSNQGTIVTTPVQITSAAQAGNTYGYGSPIHAIARQLLPNIGGVPVYVMAQLAASGATATVIVWTITGTATASTTHYIRIAGRQVLDYATYAVNIVVGDSPTAIVAKYVAAINVVLGSPVIASAAAGVLTLTSKWTGLTSADLTAVINSNGNAAGLTYTLTSTTAGTATPSIAAALAQFQSNWYNLVINSYGVAQVPALEAFNGVPDAVNPTGQYLPQVFMPFMAFFGSTDATASDLVTITDNASRVNQVTNVLCPAPGSGNMPYEVAAAWCLLFANVMASNPHLTIAGQSLVDITPPVSNLIGDLSNYTNRNLLKSKGCSTVMLVNGAYQIQDSVTTYHPTGEVPLVFNETRYLAIDWNVYYGYNLLQIANLNDKTIVADGQYTTVQNVITPSDWKAILFTYFDSLAQLALITDPAFSKSTLAVQIDPNNPNRFNTTFSYKRTGTAEIESTTVTVGF